MSAPSSATDPTEATAPTAASDPSDPSDPSGAGGASGPGRPGLDEPPPFWSRWGRIYWFVAALLAAQVLAFWLLSRWAA